MYEAKRVMNDAIKPIIHAAETEQAGVGLPDYEEGPQDAYRHLVGAAELRRRFGIIPAYGILMGNEFMGAGAGNSSDSISQDLHNNRIALGIGATANTFDDVIARAREAMLAGISVGGTGEGETPRWAPPSTGAEPWADAEFRFPDEMPGTQAYPFGGRDYGFLRQLSPRQREERLLDDLAQLPPSAWTDHDVRSVIRSRPYSDSRDPSRAEWHDRVREHFEAREALSAEPDSLEAE